MGCPRNSRDGWIYDAPHVSAPRLTDHVGFKPINKAPRFPDHFFSKLWCVSQNLLVEVYSCAQSHDDSVRQIAAAEQFLAQG